jgi:hypothetical protein
VDEFDALPYGTTFIRTFIRVVNGHNAASFTGTREDLRMVANVEPDDEPRGLVVGDKVQGLGISNMKRGPRVFHDGGQGPEKERHQAQG